MKPILLIFSIYLLLLPGIACTGADNCSEELTNTVGRATSHGEREKEDCGNFCNCSCCVHIVSVNFQLSAISIDKPVSEGTKHSFYHNISLPSNYFGNIWQPPKMG
jgi:hypothetical protein